MANNTQINIHIVFAVQGRQNLCGVSTTMNCSKPTGHHRCKSFSEQYVELLKRFNVPHDQRYIFQPVDPD